MNWLIRIVLKNNCQKYSSITKMDLKHHIVSHHVYTGQELIKNGKITYGQDKIIQSIVSTDLKHAESARTMFYSGLLVPAVFPEATNEVTVEEIYKQSIDVKNIECIDASGMVHSKLIEWLARVQKSQNLYGEAFLAVWNKLSVVPSLRNHQDYAIESGNRIRVLNLRGLDPKTFAISEQSKVISIERNLLL